MHHSHTGTGTDNSYTWVLLMKYMYAGVADSLAMHLAQPWVVGVLLGLYTFKMLPGDFIDFKGFLKERAW